MPESADSICAAVADADSAAAFKAEVRPLTSPMILTFEVWHGRISTPLQRAAMEVTTNEGEAAGADGPH
jgi:hypothetical protein